jgi:hypothetical protein
MAWIESHQELPRHPKTKRLARVLGISIPETIGYLHILWYWAMDFARDGDLSGFDVSEIADAAMWERDAQTFVNAAMEAGFFDPDMHLHDWYDYAGKLIARREKDRDRKAKKKDSDGILPEVQWGSDEAPKTSDGIPRNSASTIPNLTIPNLTIPDLTVPDPTVPKEKNEHLSATPQDTSSSPDGDDPADDTQSPASASPKKNPPTPYQKILQLYNETCTRLPKITRIDGDRQKHVKARFNSYGDIEFFRQLFSKAQSSNFLCGENNKSWTANFDWLIKPTNMAKVLEDKYVNSAVNPPNRGHPKTGNPFFDYLERMGDDDP